MGFLSVIRRWALRDKMPIREISRRTGLSRNTIRKYLRSGVVEPQFQKPARPSKLDPYAETISAWLVTEQRRSRKERRTVKQMHADLVSLGYDGSYERVAAFVRTWKQDRQKVLQTTGRGTFVPLVFQPGEAFQFDWSEDWAYIGGERVKLQVAHAKLSHSRAFLVRAYPARRRTRCCSTLTGTPSACSAACRGVAYTIAGIVRHWSEDNGREDGCGPDRPRQAARCERAISGDDQPLCL